MSTASTEVAHMHGTLTYGLKVSHNDPRNPNGRTLANRWHASEFEALDLIETYQHPKHPGISVIFLHEATREETLGEARARNPHPQEFLLSRIGESVIVASSCLGYKETGPVTAYENRSTDVVISGLDYIDYSTKEVQAGRNLLSLVGVHLDRVSKLGGNPDLALSQADADHAFRLMLAGTQEIR